MLPLSERAIILWPSSSLSHSIQLARGALLHNTIVRAPILFARAPLSQIGFQSIRSAPIRCENERRCVFAAETEAELSWPPIWAAKWSGFLGEEKWSRSAVSALELIRRATCLHLIVSPALSMSSLSLYELSRERDGFRRARLMPSLKASSKIGALTLILILILIRSHLVSDGCDRLDGRFIHSQLPLKQQRPM